jgi:hypothetical protein
MDTFIKKVRHHLAVMFLWVALKFDHDFIQSLLKEQPVVQEVPVEGGETPNVA